MAFQTERDLVGAAVAWLGSSFLFTRAESGAYLGLELQGLFGRPDAVLVRFRGHPDGAKIRDTSAFEAKLSNWRRGLAQAYRYKAFATRAFVLIDEAHAHRAYSSIDLFRRSNIGLLSLDEEGNVAVYYWPTAEEPYCGRLSGRLETMVVSEVSLAARSNNPSTELSQYSTAPDRLEDGHPATLQLSTAEVA